MGFAKGDEQLSYLREMQGNRKYVKIAQEEKLGIKDFLNLNNNEIWTRKAVYPTGEEPDSGFKY